MPARRSSYLLVAAVGLIAAAAVAVGGWWLAGEAHRTLSRTLGVAGDAVVSGQDTVVLAGSTLDDLEAGLLALESGLAAAGDAFGDLPPVIDELSVLAAEDLPTGLEGVAGTAVALRDLAAGLDQALRPLRALGVEAGPVGDLTESLDDIEASLSGIPERLRSQAVRLEAAAAGLGTVDGEIDTLVAQVQSTRTGLGDARGIVRRYEATAADAADLVETATADLDRQVVVGRGLALALAVAIAALQFVPLTLARRPQSLGA